MLGAVMLGASRFVFLSGLLNLALTDAFVSVRKFENWFDLKIDGPERFVVRLLLKFTTLLPELL